MNIPIDMTFGAGDFLKVFSTSENDALADIISAGYTLAQVGIKIPDSGPCVWVSGLNLEVTDASVVQVGFLDGDDNFCPLDTHVCTPVAGGGISRVYDGHAGLQIPLEIDGEPVFPAIKAGSATRVCGNFDIKWSR